MRNHLIILSGLLAGCSLFNVKSDRLSSSQPETRDAAFAARAKNTGEMRKRMIVLPVIDGTPRRSESNAQVARRTLVAQLAKSDQVVLVNPADFPRDLSRMRSESEYNMEEVAKVAAGMGVAVVVEAKLLDIRVRKLADAVGVMRAVRAKVEGTMRIRAFSARTGKEILNDTRTADLESTTTRLGESPAADRDLDQDEALVEAVVAKAAQISVQQILRSVHKVGWEGRVALVRGEKVYLNAGRASGLQVGDIVKVTEEGEDIFDPDTGALIGRVPGHMKGTLEVVSYLGQDGAVAVVHSGAGFKENDRVELY